MLTHIFSRFINSTMLPMLRLLRVAGPNALASGQQVYWLQGLTGRSSTSQEDIHAANEELNQMFTPAAPAVASTTHPVHQQASHHAPPEHTPPNPFEVFAMPGTQVQPSQHAGVHNTAGGHQHNTPHLTHVDDRGHAHMVDISGKPATTRTARASCVVHLGPVAFPLVDHNRLAKGDVLSTAELAGIMAAKQTATLIPLCHNITLSKVAVDLHLDAPSNSVRIVSTATTVSATGVEMEALTAAAVAALTVYDMCKAAAKDIEITDLKLDAKSGGKSSDYLRGAGNHGNVVNLPHGADTPNPTS